MKPLERIFFMACVNEQRRVHELQLREFSVRMIANIFSRLGFSYKQLMYYVQKWSSRGFYDYGVTMDLGWFYFDELKGEYLDIFKSVHMRDGWRDGELSKMLFKQANRGKTNYAVRRDYGIGEDKKFYGEK